MKKLRFVRDTFRVLAYGVFLAVVLCGGCSDNGIGTAVGESKIPSIPSAPPNVVAKAVSSSSITVSWSSVSSATGYNVYCSTSVNRRYKVGGTKSTLYTDTGLFSGTNYCYKVFAYNLGGENSLSSNVCAPTIPDAPDNLSGVATSQSNVTISWSPVFGATGYNVYRDTLANGSNRSKVKTITSPSDTSYTNTGLSSGKTYYYWVSAYNSSGESSPALYATIIPPDPPSKISATATSSSSIFLKWSSVSGAVGYYIYRDTTFNGNSRSKVWTTSSKSDTSHTDKELLSGTVYYYWVSAYNSGGEGPQSSPYVSAITPLDTTSDVSVTARSSNSISLKWSSVLRSSGYYVYRATSADGSYNKVGTAPSTSYKNDGLLPCVTYYYKVVAYNKNTEGAMSLPPVEATTLSDPPSVTATAVSSSSVTVDWSSACGAEGYFVYRSEGASGTYDMVLETSDTSYQDVELSSGTIYCYKVAAYNSSGDTTELSSYACATTHSEVVPLIDDRDGKTYATVTMGGGKVWMAENLKYEAPGESWCYGNDESMCEKYGRLYSWVTAMGIDSYYYGNMLGDDANHQGICPVGWHLPSRQEWGSLAGTAGTTGTRLKSNTGWDSYSGVPKGTDDYGFSALPGGYGEHSGDDFSGAGMVGYWWTATEDYSDGNAYYRSMRYNNEAVGEDVDDKRIGMSVRCVQD